MPEGAVMERRNDQGFHEMGRKAYTDGLSVGVMKEEAMGSRSNRSFGTELFSIFHSGFPFHHHHYPGRRSARNGWGRKALTRASKSLRPFCPAILTALLLSATGIAQEQTPDTSAAGAPRRITLDQAQQQAAAAAAAGAGARLAQLAVDAARYHRKAAQSDYFPKVNAGFANLHFNKFMGQEIQLARRNFSLPLLNKDQTTVFVTVTQPLTPLFKVHEAVKIARADERIAEGKAGQTVTQLTTDVEQLYYRLLIADRQRSGAENEIKFLEGKLQLASVSGGPPVMEMGRRQAALTEANKTLLSAKSQAIELTQSLNALMGQDRDALWEPVAFMPPPAEDRISLTDATAQAMFSNPAVTEAEQNVVKARAAARLSKLEYVPDVAILGAYTYQNAIPLLPLDFSFIGVVASYNVFDFGKRERTIRERKTQVAMAETALELARAQVSAGVQKTHLDLDRARRVLELTRRLAAMYQAAPESSRTDDLETKSARAKAEAEMFQAELDYRLAYSQLKRAIGGK
jgi:outer membrane protein TolC